MNARIVFVLAVFVLTGFWVNADIVFQDDFESYDVLDPSLFEVGGVTPIPAPWTPSNSNAGETRIYDTGNYAGTRLWICSASSDTSITSAPISVESDTYYIFKAALVCETYNATRENTCTYDLLIGETAATATSAIGGPVTVTTHGDDSGGAGDNTYDEQYTTDGFTTGTIGANDKLFIIIIHIPDGDAWFGVDNVSIEKPEIMDIVESDGQTLVSEDGLDDSYEIRVFGVGADDVEVTITPDAQLDLGAGAGIAISAVFTQGGSETYTVTVNAVDDGLSEGTHAGLISHTVISNDATYTSYGLDNVSVAIEDNEPYCGDSNTIYLPGDLNEDCYVNLLDIAVLALEWMQCTDPADPLCIAQ